MTIFPGALRGYLVPLGRSLGRNTSKHGECFADAAATFCVLAVFHDEELVPRWSYRSE
jgi:hypothetical protein